MARPEFDLNLMRVFVAVLREGSTIAAARRLGLTQSAVSHALRRMREQFGDPLFIRAPSGLAPSPRAMELAPIVEAILRRVDEELLSKQTFDPASAEREIRIALSDIGEVSMVPPIFAALAQEAPHCSLRTTNASPAEAYRMLQDRELELIITANPLNGPELHRQWLFNEHFLVMGSKDHFSGAFDLDAYLCAEHLAVALPGKQVTLIDETLARLGRTRRIKMVTEHYLIVPHLLQSNPNLLASVPAAVTDAARIFADLGSAPLPFPMPEVEVFQLWHSANNRHPFHAWLRGLVKRCSGGRAQAA